MSVGGKELVRTVSGGGSGLRWREPVDLRGLKGEERRGMVEGGCSIEDFVVGDGTVVSGAFLRYGYKSDFLDREVAMLDGEEGRVCLGEDCMGEGYDQGRCVGHDLVEREVLLVFLSRHGRERASRLKEMVLPWISQEGEKGEEGLMERLSVWMMEGVRRGSGGRNLDVSQGMAFGRLVEVCAEGHEGCAQKLCAEAACMADLGLGWGARAGRRNQGRRYCELWMRPAVSELRYLLTLAYGGEVVGNVDWVAGDGERTSVMSQYRWDCQLAMLYMGELETLYDRTFRCSWHSLKIGLFGKPYELWNVGHQVCLLNMALGNNQRGKLVNKSIEHAHKQVEHFKEGYAEEELAPRWQYELGLIERVLECLEDGRSFRVEKRREVVGEEDGGEGTSGGGMGIGD